MRICAICKEKPAGETHTHYCPDCWRKYQRDRWQAKRRPIIRECGCGCGETFQVPSSRSRRQYVDARHKAKAATAKAREVRLAERGERLCEMCDNVLPPDARADRHTCSELCAQRRRHARAKEHRKRWRRANTLAQYGLTLETYEALVEKQNGRCAVCQSDDPGPKGIWHIDHCHSGGQVRGLLCSACNTGLGQFKDRPNVLRAAADYLERTA